MFKVKYFPNGSIFQAKSSSGSFAWQSILKTCKVVLDGIIWREGDGKAIRVFEDRCLPGQNPSKFISPWTSIDDD